MSCKTYSCNDEKDSLGPDGECHPYDETLEQRFDDLKTESENCAKSFNTMNIKMEELLAQLKTTMDKNQELESKLANE